MNFKLDVSDRGDAAPSSSTAAVFEERDRENLPCFAYRPRCVARSRVFMNGAAASVYAGDCELAPAAAIVVS